MAIVHDEFWWCCSSAICPFTIEKARILIVSNNIESKAQSSLTNLNGSDFQNLASVDSDLASNDPLVSIDPVK